jgi:hypothetical protein
MIRMNAMVAATAVASLSSSAHADSGWRVLPFGSIELDTIYDSTQGMSDVVGAESIARPGTYAGDNAQTTFSARATRVGVELDPPVEGELRTRGVLEIDFLGAQPPTASEQATWVSPAPRLRQAYLAVDSRFVDVTIGETWQLFGGQPLFLPETVAIQGVPGEVYERTPQIRISRSVALGDSTSVSFELAAARPPQRASATPDGQAAISLVFPHVRARHAGEGAATRVDPLTLSVSAIGRRFAVDNISGQPTYEVVKDGYGIAGSALLPLRDGDGGHALTLVASIVSGAGISDLYQSLTNGVVNPTVPGYTANIDPDLAMWSVDSRSPSGYSLHTIQCESELLGLQYFPTPRIWFGANFGHFHSGNSASFGPRPQVWNDEDFVDGSAFVSITSAFRVGAGLAWFQQGYVDQTLARDRRFQASAFLLF